MARTPKNQSPEKEEKKSLLDKEMEKIEKQYGVGTMVGDSDKNRPLDIIPSGSLKFDIASGVGGYARGKVYEYMGWESCGKSTATLHAIAETQKLGLKAVLIDGEQSFDPTYARKLGVDPDDLIIHQGDDGGGERAYDIAERLIKTGEVGLCVIDSQTALLPKKMFDDPAEASNLGLHARLMSRIVPKLMTAAANHNTCIIFISQFREKIGVMYGSPETTNGGNALKMYAHVRLTFRKTVINDSDKNAKAVKISIKINKNKLGKPYDTFDYNINFGEGIDKIRELFDVAVDLGIINQAGSWYSYGETKLGQGEDNIIQMLRDNDTWAEGLKKLVIKKVKENGQQNITESSGESGEVGEDNNIPESTLQGGNGKSNEREEQGNTGAELQDFVIED